MGSSTIPPRPPNDKAALERLYEKLDAIHRELVLHRRLFDEFAGVYLKAKFPFGKSTDRWGRRG
jgi:hypothetical protein